ncbi:hypothetical protein K2Z84_06600 [Candidatus Binatia bacterium]|jgi:hypothetical protein|nr:hypothetical protein [Candidatus Binatia bacterium]
MFRLGLSLEPRRLVAILAALVVVLASLPNATVCIGSDGHFAVETVGAVCGTATPSAEPSLHGCTDTPLGTATLQGQSDPGRRELCAPADVLVASLSNDRWRVETRPPSDVPRVPTPVSRSTVLLL